MWVKEFECCITSTSSHQKKMMKDEEVEKQKKNVKKIDEKEYLEVVKKMGRKRSRIQTVTKEKNN
jgi:hypothetical protein